MGSIPITQRAKCSPNKYNANLVAGEAQTFNRFQDASGSITDQGGGGGAPIPPVTKEKKKDDTVIGNTGTSTVVSLTDDKPNYFKSSSIISNFSTDTKLKNLSSELSIFNKKLF
jgi:hypothetical protein